MELTFIFIVTYSSILDWVRVRKNHSKKPSLDGSKIEIEKVPVCTSALISEIPNTVSNDYLQLTLEKYCGEDSIAKIHYEKEQKFASVRFRNPRGIRSIFYYNSTASMLRRLL